MYKCLIKSDLNTDKNKYELIFPVPILFAQIDDINRTINNLVLSIKRCENEPKLVVERAVTKELVTDFSYNEFRQLKGKVVNDNNKKHLVDFNEILNDNRDVQLNIKFLKVEKEMSHF